MRNVPPDKYNVAWFKLAECVSRGEKERALGVYRLLAHSLSDSAFARQLQGDILFSFNDTIGAVEHYRKAAQLYQQDERFLEAAAVYEHIVVLAQDKQEFLYHLIELYRLLGMPGKMGFHGQALCLLLLNSAQYSNALVLLDNLAQQVQPQDISPLRYQVLTTLARNDYELTLAIERHIAIHITDLIKGDEPGELQRFITALETTNDAYYAYAVTCMG